MLRHRQALSQMNPNPSREQSMPSSFSDSEEDEELKKTQRGVVYLAQEQA